MTLAEFSEKYCQMCGSQRCEGPGTEWFGGCIHRGELTSRGQPYTAEEVLDCITLALDSIYECKLCHCIIYPKIYLDGDDIRCEVEANDICGGLGNHILVDHVCNDCYKRIAYKT